MIYLPIFVNLPIIGDFPLLFVQNDDGAPPHFSVAVYPLLNYEFSVRWLGRKEQIAMLALSPDLDSLVLYLRDHHESNVGLAAAVFNL